MSKVKGSQKANLDSADRCKKDLRKRGRASAAAQVGLPCKTEPGPGSTSETGGALILFHFHSLEMWLEQMRNMIGTDEKYTQSQKSALQDWGLGYIRSRGEPTNPSERSLQILGMEDTNPKEGA